MLLPVIALSAAGLTVVGTLPGQGRPLLGPVVEGVLWTWLYLCLGVAYAAAVMNIVSAPLAGALLRNKTHHVQKLLHPYAPVAREGPRYQIDPSGPPRSRTMPALTALKLHDFIAPRDTRRRQCADRNSPLRTGS